MVQQTSLEAYFSVQEELGKKQQVIYAAIKALGEATDKDVSHFLHVPINTVTPRRLEIYQKGLIMYTGQKVQEGRKAMMWRIR